MATLSKPVRRRRRVSDAASPSLPEDIVVEILSLLPVESLLRFKCVCKKWGELIQRDELVEMHHRRAAMCFYEYINEPTVSRMSTDRPLRKNAQFWCIDTQRGLVLEHERREDPTERLRIRNPATRQTVYLPDLLVDNEPPTWVVARMSFVGNQCTVISFSESEESVQSGRFRALTVGVDAAWRPLKNSPADSIHRIGDGHQQQRICALSIANVFHVVTIDAHHKQILSIDAEDESFKSGEIPENLFSDWSNVMPIEWNAKLSLFCYDGDEINIWALHDEKEWAKTQIVDLATFTQDYPIPFITEGEKVWIRGVNGERWEIIWSPEETLSVPWRRKNAIAIKPTILHLPGMQTEKVEAAAMDTHFWEEKVIPTTPSQIVYVIWLTLAYVLLL